MKRGIAGALVLVLCLCCGGAGAQEGYVRYEATGFSFLIPYYWVRFHDDDRTVVERAIEYGCSEGVTVEEARNFLESRELQFVDYRHSTQEVKSVSFVYAVSLPEGKNYDLSVLGASLADELDFPDEPGMRWLGEVTEQTVDGWEVVRVVRTYLHEETELISIALLYLMQDQKVFAFSYLVDPAHMPDNIDEILDTFVESMKFE